MPTPESRDAVPAPDARAFVLNTNERSLWGVRFSNDVLRLRTTGARQAAEALLVVALCVFTVVVVFAPTDPTLTIFFFTTHSRLATGTACGLMILAVTFILLAGSVVATRDGISRRWLGVRRLRWDDVDHLGVVERVPWWQYLGPWFAVEVVEATTHDGRRLILWPTRSTVARRTGAEGPTPAQVKRELLQRYRDIYAPSGPAQS